MAKARVRTKYFQLRGGLDVVTAPLTIDPGAALTMVNFEPWYNGGYRRIAGFERFDGRPRPSDATFVGFDIDTIVGLVEGTTVLTGDTSGATGTVIGVFDSSGGQDEVGVAQVTGTFINGEPLNTAAFAIESVPTVGRAPGALQDQWDFNAEAENREDILVVPGINQVRGIWQLGATVYSWRNNVGETVGIMHRSTTSGWTTAGITLADTLRFDAGGGGTQEALPLEGETIEGVSSGATGVVHRIIEHSGSVANDDAVGYMVLTSVAGGPFQNNESLKVGATNFALADGVEVTFAFAINGHYRFFNHNFFAGAATFRAYGANGVNAGFEIDSSHVVSPILLPVDATALPGQPASNIPFDIEEHRNHLFFAFPGGSVQQAVVGQPLTFNGFLGAAEFGLGDEITGMNSIVGNVLVLTTERETRGLFGTGVSDWEMRLIAEKTGGKLFTAQKIDTVYALDDLGITNVNRTDMFGDFVGATVSALVQPLINTLRGLVTDSTIVRESNQYRVYFTDSSALVMYVPAGSQGRTIDAGGNKLAEFGLISYPFVVRRIYNGEDNTGKERTYFASDDGFVYEDQIGKNFDGANIQSYVRTAFTHLGSPSMRKKFRRVNLELEAARPLTLKITADLSYGASEVSSGQTGITIGQIDNLEIFAGGGFWDISNWDEFFWDGDAISAATAKLGGSGENISFLIFNDSAFSRPFILQGLTVHYDLRRLQR